MSQSQENKNLKKTGIAVKKLALHRLHKEIGRKEREELEELWRKYEA
jgi:hypothetical protein